MIRYLAITNLAVIESVSVEFEQSFNVLTGETGAGKSMLVGAVSLLLGGRASQDLVRTGEDVATVEAIFEAADGREVIVRREVTAHGRSRAFVDGQLTTSSALRPHRLRVRRAPRPARTPAPARSAHASAVARRLGRPRGPGRRRPRRPGTILAAAERTLERAAMDAGERAARLELVEFHLGELQRARLAPGEDDELTQTRDVLRHAGRLTTLCGEAYGLLYDDEAAALSTLGQVWKRVGRAGGNRPGVRRTRLGP